ncbi:MAG TPA: hypothetical protein VGB77_19205, partial [Abditibacteriaceae bacterium]
MLGLKAPRNSFKKPSKKARREKHAASQTPQPQLEIASDILIRLQADIDERGQFGQPVMEVSKEQVRVLDGEIVSFQVPISDIKAARNEPLIGG